nr:hypothetical protein [Catellatospora tritici]
MYAWHCDREGRYSLYSSGVTNQNYLRGIQVTNASGTVTFTSVYPAATRVGGRTSTSRSSPRWPTPPPATARS